MTVQRAESTIASPDASGRARVDATAGAYAHIPFCARKCPYCDFYTFGAEHPLYKLSSAYLDRLMEEIEAAPARFGFDAAPRIDAIYFGGGTPSLIEPERMRELLVAIGRSFRVESDAEIAMEVNPTAAEAGRLRGYREIGVNRLSVGVQSFDDRNLQTLGRDHDSAAARRTLALTRELGYGNVSLDLMFALPGQSIDDLDRDLSEALAFGPEHISVYGLTYHPATPFHRWREEGRLQSADPDLEAALFERIIDRLGKSGYEHYEISNWSRPGRASRHNSKYWRRCDIHAFGPSAHGVFGGRRYANPRDLKQYLERDWTGAGRAIDWEAPPATPRAAAGEAMMLAIRRLEGVDWSELTEWIGADPREIYRDEIDRLIEEKLIDADGSALRLTRRGVLLADVVAVRFF
jgi:oxygen-independent coproporphyrinogen-3 oxidase